MASTLEDYIRSRLPEGYLITTRDEKWLDACSKFHDGKESNYSVLAAVQAAVAVHGIALHIDPYELLIDAGICTKTLTPLP